MSRLENRKRAVFVHHSVGRQLIDSSGMRELLAQESIDLVDVDYNRIGARDAGGKVAGVPTVPNDDTDITAIATLLEGESEFVKWLGGFDVVAMKSCYPNSNLSTDLAEQAQRSELRRIGVAAARRFKAFVWVTPPPLPPLRTSRAAAQRALEVARSSTSLLGSGVLVVDLHSRLSDDRGLLARDYRRKNPLDAHPNRVGAALGGSLLIEAIGHALTDRRE